MADFLVENDITNMNPDVTIAIARTPLGEGAYGRIMRCWYNNGNSRDEIIVKMIDEMERVNSSIIEGIIMSSIRHPYIVDSVKIPIIHGFYQKRRLDEIPQPIITPSVEVKRSRRLKLPIFHRKSENINESQPSPIINHNRYADPSNDIKWKRMLYFQPKAVGDLDECPWIGHHSEVVYTAWQLLNAVYAIHNENVIHGDIKPSNILYYSDGGIPHIKLTDFSLSVINNGKNRGTIGSPYYSAPESLANDFWNEKIDLWSIGCTLYYLYYGEVLFPVQRVELEDPEERHKERRLRELKCIVDWSNTSIYMNNVSRVTNYEKVSNCRLFEKNSFNDLIKSMLYIEPERRSSVVELLNSDIFNMTDKFVIYTVHDLDSVELDEEYAARIKSLCYTRQNNIDEILFRTSVKMCSRVWELSAIVGISKLITSVISLSYTLINGCVLIDFGSDDEVEDLILNYTGMRLLCCLNDRN